MRFVVYVFFPLQYKVFESCYYLPRYLGFQDILTAFSLYSLLTQELDTIL